MSVLVIIRGPLGIGKSTISKEISKKLKGEYISIDIILEREKLDKIEGEGIPLKNFLKANKIIIPEIKEILESGKDVVIDGNFYYEEQIEDLIANLNCKNYVFTLKASLETCINRDSGRKRVYGIEATTAVYSLVNKFDYGIVIDCDSKNINEVIKEVLSKINK